VVGIGGGLTVAVIIGVIYFKNYLSKIKKKQDNPGNVAMNDMGDVHEIEV